MKVFILMLTLNVLGSVSLAESGTTRKRNPSQGQPCPEGKCEAGFACITYYGIAGPNGPEFKSCEIPCQNPQGPCPKGQSCFSMPDGPGPVCRPKRRE